MLLTQANFSIKLWITKFEFELEILFIKLFVTSNMHNFTWKALQKQQETFYVDLQNIYHEVFVFSFDRVYLLS